MDSIKRSVADLGLPEGPTTEEIYAAARESGLDLCPAWVGPQLRLDYDDQPDGEILTIAMEPITDDVGEPCVFGVDRSGSERRLSSRIVHPGVHWNAGTPWVFALRK